MSNSPPAAKQRLVPQVPPQGEPMRLLIDTDIANEIDDLYGVTLALISRDRFRLEGFIASHFAAKAGPESIDASHRLMLELLDVAGPHGEHPVRRGADPMQYPGYPSEGEGVDFIIERAHAGRDEDPLWVVCLGAATNLASAILKEPGIIPRVRYVFHARGSHVWPERSVQFNVRGDVLAVQTLLASQVPLVWFDTGTHLRCSFEETERHAASTGPLGAFIHNYRRRRDFWMSTEKGFFDLADIAWLIQPELCQTEVVPAPTMDRYMFFDHDRTHGPMLRVYDIENRPTWELLFERLRRHYAREA